MKQQPSRSLALRAVSAAISLIPLAAAHAATPTYPNQETVCTFNAAREAQRLASAANFAQPVVTSMLVNGAQVWTAGSSAVPALKPGDIVTLNGSGFGAGTATDFSKILIGNSRVLETDLVMYEQKVDIASSLNYETGVVRSSWPKDVISWSDSQVKFTVPAHASKGPLKLQVQKRTGYNLSLTKPGQPHNIIDAQVYRVPAPADVNCDVVSTPSAESKAIAPINVSVSNASFSSMVTLGRQIFWSYDFNLGLSHKYKNLEWEAILGGTATDPYTRAKADPAVLFGAYKNVSGQVPAESINDVYFKPYPQPNPTPGFLTLTPQLTEGNTKTTGWVGYRYAESSHPILGKGSWPGFNCASCHGYKISYTKGLTSITKVFPGLPNPGWSMKWATLGTNTLSQTTSKFAYVNEDEDGPKWSPGSAKVDKTPLLYLMPPGTGESTITRTHGEGGLYDNDYMFSPTAIPNVTNHLPIRRALSHTESYVGFEGSYIHAEEPDGAMGSMDATSLKALTAYMSTLDGDDTDLRNVGMYRWLKANGKLSQTGNAALTEGSFVQNGWQSYAGVSTAVAQGKATFDQACASCHSDKVGANTTEVMVPLNQVGRFFAPTDFQRKQQAIRATYLRNLYWVSSRGLLSDAHVRNLEDLVNPDRCNESSALYKQYYTIHAPARPAPGTPDQPTPAPDLNRKGDVFRVYKAKPGLIDTISPARNLFVERHKYFTTIAGDTSYYYWDYQKMRTQYGPDEMGTPAPIGMPAAPHPWCASSASQVQNLVQYLLTL